MPEVLEQWLNEPVVRQFLAAAFGLAIVYGIVQFLQRSLSSRVRDNDTRYRVRKLIALLGYLAAALLISSVFSDRLSGLTVAFGVAGAGIAFALQEVIVSIAGWIAISFGDFYSPGQRVQLGGIRGDVIDIGVLRTTLMEVGDWVDGDLYNGRIVRVANSSVFKEPVFNYSADFPFLWDEVRIPIRYGSDMELARAILKRCLEEVVGDYPEQSKTAWKRLVAKYRLEDASVDVMVSMSGDENWMTFTGRYIVDYRQRRGTKDAIYTRLFRAIQESDGKVMVASATLDITALPPLQDSREPHSAS